MATPAVPCAFHGYEPKPTLVERLINADQVVLARPSAATPFRFDVTKQMRGDASVGTLPFLVDSTTRRLMRLKPQANVLFARDADTEVWHRLATVDADFDPVMHDIWSALPDWQDNPAMRATYFSKLLHHRDRRLRDLALRELDLAAYGTLRALDLEIDANALRSQLDVITEMDLRAIRILLMGFAEPSEDLSAFLKDRITTGVAHDSDMLGAYALSLIALEGRGGLRWLSDTHLSSTHNTYNTHSAMVQALAMHFQTGDSALREEIEEILTARVLFDPDLAYVVSLQFSAIAANAGLEVPESDLDEDPSLEALKSIEVSKLIPLQN
ncbi:hypothetical protein [Shimia sp. MIT1388]|uniref:hypothetical protein n=1 Tax=Shimia sp. MIT1388 TaxID=3096992 RepID=UPI00399BAF0B